MRQTKRGKIFYGWYITAVAFTANFISVGTGFYIFNLKGKTAPKLATLKEVKKDIYDLLFHKKFQERFLAWLEKLKKEAYIEIKK